MGLRVRMIIGLWVHCAFEVLSHIAFPPSTLLKEKLLTQTWLLLHEISAGFICIFASSVLFCFPVSNSTKERRNHRLGWFWFRYSSEEFFCLLFFCDKHVYIYFLSQQMDANSNVPFSNPVFSCVAVLNQLPTLFLCVNFIWMCPVGQRSPTHLNAFASSTSPTEASTQTSSVLTSRNFSLGLHENAHTPSKCDVTVGGSGLSVLTD